MQSGWLQRAELVLGEEALALLSNKRICVLGLGGVGGATAEALVRSGLGSLLLADADTVEKSNLNRQLIATVPELGNKKTQACARRLLSINPQCRVDCFEQFVCEENLSALLDGQVDFVVDAIDTVTSKIALAVYCTQQSIPLVSCFGTGNKLAPEQLKIGTLAQTAGCGCPLARVMRRELRRRGIEQLDVVYSTEEPRRVAAQTQNGRHSPGSVSFVPPVAGFLLASFVVRRLLGLL